MMNSLQIVIILLLALFLNCCNKSQEFIKLEIFGCRSTDLFIVENDKLIYPNSHLNPDDPSEYNFVINISTKDVDEINKTVTQFLSTEERKILDNQCIVDGTGYKLKFYQGTELVDQVLLRNYYDNRLSSIFEILNKYLSLKQTEFDISLDTFSHLKNQESCLEAFSEGMIRKKLDEECR